MRSNKFHRLNYLMALEIPTYGGFKYIQFYDVLQMMTQKVIEFNYEKEKISTMKSQLKVVGVLGGLSANKSYTL